MYCLAAEQGVADAQYNIGIMYRDGLGVLQNHAEVEKWWRLAAEQGIAKAQVNLGVSYAAGEGVPQDYVTAHMWFNLAAAQGHTKAQEGRDAVAGVMTPDQIAEAQRMAGEWMAKHPQ